MKNSAKILFGGVLFFGVITWATMNLDYDADGADQYGFPFNFYTKVSGYNEVTMQGGTSVEFNTLNFVYDLTFGLLLSWLMVFAYKKLRRPKNITN